MAPKPGSNFTWLAKYLSLGLTLPASVAAGFILARVLEHWLRIAWLPAVGIVLGMTAGLIQIIRELSRESKSDNK